MDLSDSPPSSWPHPAPLPLPPLPPAAAPYPSAPYPAGAVYPYPLPYFYYIPAGPRVWTVFVGFVIAFVLAQLAGLAVMSCMLLVKHPDAMQSPDKLAKVAEQALADPVIVLPYLLAMQVVLAGSVIGAAYLSPQRFVRRLRVGRSTLPWLAYPLIVIGAIGIGLLFDYLTQFLPVKPEGPLKMLNDMFRQLTPRQVIAAVLVVGAGPAFGEELLCRGYMQTRLSQRWGRWAAISITAALFGIMHLSLVQGTFAAFFGVYLGHLAEKTGSIRPGMFCHFANNAFQVVLARYGENWNVTLLLIIGVVAAACLIASVLYLWLAVKPPPTPPQEQPVTQPWPYFLPSPAPPPAPLS